MYNFPTDNAPQDRLFQLHIAEYAALTTRSSYYIVTGSSYFPLLALILIGLFTTWKSLSHAFVIWVSVFTVDVFLLALLDNLKLQYKNINYIEKKLRPLVLPLVGPENAFWCYERHLEEERGRPQWWERGPWVGAALVFVLALIARLYEIDWRFVATTLWDYLGLLISFYLIPLFWLRSKDVVALRHATFKAGDS